MKFFVTVIANHNIAHPELGFLEEESQKLGYQCDNIKIGKQIIFNTDYCIEELENIIRRTGRLIKNGSYENHFIGQSDTDFSQLNLSPNSFFFLISPKQQLLDPPAKLIQSHLEHLGYHKISSINIGKVIIFSFNTTEQVTLFHEMILKQGLGKQIFVGIFPIYNFVTEDCHYFQSK